MKRKGRAILLIIISTGLNSNANMSTPLQNFADFSIPEGNLSFSPYCFISRKQDFKREKKRGAMND